MNVNETELWLRMAQMAAQFSQSSLPQVGNSSDGAGEKSQFQTMLEDKKAQAEPSKPEQKPADSTTGQEEPVQKPGEDGEQAGALPPEKGQNSQAAAELAAALTAMGIPVQAPVVVQEPQGIEPQAEILPAMAEVPSVTVEQPQMAEVPVVQEPQTPQTVPLQEEVRPAEPVQTQEMPQKPEPVQGQTQQEIQPVVQEKAEVRAEAADVRTGGKPAEDAPDAVLVQDDRVGQPLFREVESMPVKVGETPALDTASNQMEADLSQTLMGALEQGEQRVELRLSPEHLGTLTVELIRGDSGVLQVVLRTESEQAAHLLREHASTLSQLLQGSGQGEVRVEVPQPQESERPWQQPDQQNGQQENGQSRQQERQSRREDTEDFLHQLRLGLYQTELV